MRGMHNSHSEKQQLFFKVVSTPVPFEQRNRVETTLLKRDNQHMGITAQRKKCEHKAEKNKKVFQQPKKKRKKSYKKRKKSYKNGRKLNKGKLMKTITGWTDCLLGCRVS